MHEESLFKYEDLCMTVSMTDVQLVHLGPLCLIHLPWHLRPFMAESRVPDDGRCVYVGNVAKYAEWQELKDYMRPGSGSLMILGRERLGVVCRFHAQEAYFSLSLIDIDFSRVLSVS